MKRPSSKILDRKVDSIIIVTSLHLVRNSETFSSIYATDFSLKFILVILKLEIKSIIDSSCAFTIPWQIVQREKEKRRLIE